jgi:TonB-dependent receptor
VVVSSPGYETERIESIVNATTTTRLDVELVLSFEQLATVRVQPLLDASRRALNQQRNAPNITTVVSADQLGRFPDGNAAEALQRLAGMSITRDLGEGRDVLVRGTASRLNSVMMNGERLPTPDPNVRAVALNIIPADLLQTVEVAKTLLPSADMDAIGGAVNLYMREVSQRPAWMLSFGGGYNELTNSARQVNVGRQRRRPDAATSARPLCLGQRERSVPRRGHPARQVPVRRTGRSLRTAVPR